MIFGIGDNRYVENLLFAAFFVFLHARFVFLCIRLVFFYLCLFDFHDALLFLFLAGFHLISIGCEENRNRNEIQHEMEDELFVWNLSPLCKEVGYSHLHQIRCGHTCSEEGQGQRAPQR